MQKVRAAVARAQCLNHLRQIGLALHGFHDADRGFPSAGTYHAGAAGAWSVHTRLLPHLEQTALYQQINFHVPFVAQPAVTQTRVAVFLCPSEVNDRANGNFYPTSYAANFGTWLILDPRTGQTGDGAFIVNGRTRMADMTDGTSSTLAFTEVRPFLNFFLDSGLPGAANASPPGSPGVIQQWKGKFAAGGHTQWCNPSVVQSGFTTTFPPNTFVPYDEPIYNANNTIVGYRTHDMEYVSLQEGTPGAPTYAAVTARTWHTGVINVLYLDGSARGVLLNVSLTTWQALGTRRGGEWVADH
ncbi:MAG: DUF1559 domain-containing protein [Gemmataceae bacterium]|nr:DUF1559 domain-containing protein [Gemmataceae bacterium]